MRILHQLKWQEIARSNPAIMHTSLKKTSRGAIRVSRWH
jgi:hypothetical protein